MTFLRSIAPGRRRLRVGMGPHAPVRAITVVDAPVSAFEFSSQHEADTPEMPADWLASAAPIDALEFTPNGDPELDAPSGTLEPAGRETGTVPCSKRSAKADAPAVTLPITQATAAAHLIRKWGHLLHWRSDAKQWLLWDGNIWAPDRSGRITRVTLDAIIEHYSGETTKSIRESQKKSSIDAVAGSNGGLAASMLKQDRTTVSVTTHELDMHHDWLPVANGYIHLPTGRLAKSNRRMLMTKASPIKYLASATCPTWEKFITDVACEDAELVRWLQVYLGHTLSGRISQTIAWLHGPGGNGKGVMIRMLEEILGAFAVSTKTDTFMEGKFGSDSRAANPEIAKLQGARLATASEGNDGAYLDAALVKWLTGGDRITARYLNSNPVTFAPTHKIIISTNHEPSLRSSESAMERRVKIVPTRARFVADGSGEKITPPSFRHEDELRAEFPGILRWLIEGCQAWYAAGANAKAFPACQAVEDETARYFENQDSIGAFILDICNTAVNQDAKERGGDLYKQYALWCEQNAVRPVSSTKFGRDLETRGHKQIRSNGIWRTGILIRSDRKLSRH